jgi:hypothetical protein
VQPFADVIYVADDKKTFRKYIDVSLNENDRFESKRIGIARQNDWNARVEQISKIIIENCLKIGCK